MNRELFAEHCTLPLHCRSALYYCPHIILKFVQDYNEIYISHFGDAKVWWWFICQIIKLENQVWDTQLQSIQLVRWKRFLTYTIKNILWTEYIRHVLINQLIPFLLYFQEEEKILFNNSPLQKHDLSSNQCNNTFHQLMAKDKISIICLALFEKTEFFFFLFSETHLLH